MAARYGFPKAERLKSRKQIDRLFAEGRAVTAFPLRVVYQFAPATDGPPLQAGVSVSKRHFKRAVDRNRLKRLLREAYRLQKESLLRQTAAAGKSGRLFFLYTHKEMADFGSIHNAMATCLQRLGKQLQRENAS